MLHDLEKKTTILTRVSCEAIRHVTGDNIQHDDVIKVQGTKCFLCSFSLVILSRKRSKDKPGITKGIKASQLNKNSMYKYRLRNKNNINKSEYRANCNKLTKIIRQAQIMYFNEILYNHHNSAQMLWKYFGKSLNPKRIKRKDVPNRLLYEDEILSGSQNIADCFNDFSALLVKKNYQPKLKEMTCKDIGIIWSTSVKIPFFLISGDKWGSSFAS